MRKTISTFLIFLLILSFLLPSLPLVGAQEKNLPSWVRVGSHAGYYLDLGEIALKYKDKYYLLDPFDFGDTHSWGYMFWEIKKVEDVIITIHMKIEIYNLTSNEIPEELYNVLHIKSHYKNNLGMVIMNYSDERTFEVNFLKRELISNKGIVNLWINPAIDVTWNKDDVSSVQEDPHAKPVARYMGTPFIPKVMIFPTKIKNDPLHLYDPYLMTDMISDKDKEILSKNEINMTLPTGSSPIMHLRNYYDRDTGILLYGNYVDDVLFTIFNNYGAIMCSIDFNNTNIQEGGNTPGFGQENMVIIGGIIIAAGVAAWILWKRKR